MIYEQHCIGSSEKGVSLAIAAGTHRFYIHGPVGISWVITGGWASVGVAPTGADLIVDINKNGTTIFTTQANRPTIAIGGFDSGRVENMDVTSLADGDYLTADIDQVGSTVAGQDLQVFIEIETRF